MIGTALMVILDLMHRAVRDSVPDELKDGYTNGERIYIICAWPIFTYGLIRAILNNKE